MLNTPGSTPLQRHSLSRMEDRLSFLYIERAILNREGNALTIQDSRGVAHIPATQLGVVLLGPGTKVTYAAMALLGDAGCSAVWVGEKGVRYYGLQLRLLEWLKLMHDSGRTSVPGCDVPGVCTV